MVLPPNSCLLSTSTWSSCLIPGGHISCCGRSACSTRSACPACPAYYSACSACSVCCSACSACSACCSQLATHKSISSQILIIVVEARVDQEATIGRQYDDRALLTIRPFGLQVFKSQRRRNVADTKPVLTGISGRQGATPRCCQ